MEMSIIEKNLKDVLASTKIKRLAGGGNVKWNGATEDSKEAMTGSRRENKKVKCPRK